MLEIEASLESSDKKIMMSILNVKSVRDFASCKELHKHPTLFYAGIISDTASRPRPTL